MVQEEKVLRIVFDLCHAASRQMKVILTANLLVIQPRDKRASPEDHQGILLTALEKNYCESDKPEIVHFLSA